MTSSEYDALLVAATKRYADSAALLDASLRRYRPFDTARACTPEELEPYDAMCDRYLRVVEMAIRYFRTLERSRLALNSESYRDLLGNIAKWGLIEDVDLWFRMRDLRNRIADDYLPEQLRRIYEAISGEFGPEVLRLRGLLAG
ncbi:MAG: nucleotidyltransferase substrate binding protein [Betaproteobacteria bacterium]|uniref:Nucleotidyltransferase substrate binding protein n=1 Tax=Candidatus Proximibacter danicus TaxID=2954365 RepID=A0A9D7K185_9PROT|nr:nucleotidyltransferase substrate binding protein [Candidatus Proximibacter danicus]